MAVPSQAEVSAGCGHLAPAFSPGTGITPTYPGGRERYIPALPDAGDSAETGAGESGAVECPDALVLKWVSLQLNGKLPLSPRCTHTAGHRGGRTGLQEIPTHLSVGYRFMYRTDIRGVLPAYQ